MLPLMMASSSDDCSDDCSDDDRDYSDYSETAVGSVSRFTATPLIPTQYLGQQWSSNGAAMEQ